MTADLTDKVFIITGSASGMGLATATTLADRGARLALCDINNAGIQEVGKRVRSQYPGRIIYEAIDVTDRDAVRTFLAKTKKHFGQVDGIANFAGTGGHHLGVQSIWETQPQEYDFIIRLNVGGIFNILAEGLRPGFLSEPGSIVHIASMFGTRGYKNGAIFSASKHAAVGMVKSAALEVGSRGIRVNCVLPGAVDTPMFHQVRNNAGLSTSASNTPIPRPGKPEEVAYLTAFLLCDQSSYVTGATLSVDGGANA